MKQKSMNKYYKYLIYLVVFILLNAAAATLFFRLDLTRDRIYSISTVSKRVVSFLSEPLTIHVFFSKNLPAPHNNTERYLQDLLKEYAVYANHFFNYQFHDLAVKEEGEMAGKSGASEQALAENYGIYPLQIQNIEKDQVKFMRAYMGLAIIQGDMVEQIPTITSTDGLEYKITTTIQKMNDKISALVKLQNKITIKLYLSSSLNLVAPYLNITGLSEIPAKVENTVKKLNDKNFGKLDFIHLDPSRDPQAFADLQKRNIFRLQWEKQVDPSGKELPAGVGSAGVVMECEKKTAEFSLIQALRIPLIGTQYQLESIDNIEKAIDKNIENLLEMSKSIGVLSDHGVLSLNAAFAGPMAQQKEDAISNFNSLLAQNYTVQPVRLKEEAIPANIDCLVVPGAKEEFNDFELFQIDQFLMKGKSLAIFFDSFNEIKAQNQQYYSQNQGPFYVPLNTGLEKLLNHYGISVKKSYVLDEECYKQRVDDGFGGGEQPIYFAPLLQGPAIDETLPFMKNIEQLILVKVSPLEIDQKRLQDFGISALRLLSSSEKSWEMSGRINLNPYFIQKPAEGDKQNPSKSFALAYLLEGDFPSYFAGKSIPEKPVQEEKKASEEPKAKPAGLEKPKDGSQAAKKDAKEPPKPALDMSKIQNEEKVVAKGKAGKIFLIGSSEILKNNLIDQEGKSPDVLFLLNILDYLNQRQEIALMRSKTQRFNFLRASAAGSRTFVKTFNIAGLPVLVVLFGLGVWSKRKLKKKKIQAMFKK